MAESGARCKKTVLVFIVQSLVGICKGSGGCLSYRGGVVAIAGVVVVAATTGDFERGGVAFGTLLRFAMICIFLRRAARRERMPWTTVGAC